MRTLPRSGSRVPLHIAALGLLRVHSQKIQVTFSTCSPYWKNASGRMDLWRSAEITLETTRLPTQTLNPRTVSVPEAGHDPPSSTSSNSGKDRSSVPSRKASSSFDPSREPPAVLARASSPRLRACSFRVLGFRVRASWGEAGLGANQQEETAAQLQRLFLGTE